MRSRSEPNQDMALTGPHANKAPAQQLHDTPFALNAPDLSFSIAGIAAASTLTARSITEDPRIARTTQDVRFRKVHVLATEHRSPLRHLNKDLVASSAPPLPTFHDPTTTKAPAPDRHLSESNAPQTDQSIFQPDDPQTIPAGVGNSNTNSRACRNISPMIGMSGMLSTVKGGNRPPTSHRIVCTPTTDTKPDRHQHPRSKTPSHLADLLIRL